MRKSHQQQITPDQAREIAKYSYLQLGDHVPFIPSHGDVNNEIGIYNPLIDISIANTYENPGIEFVDTFRNPLNFWLTCKYLFDIDLYPFQVAVLQELWYRKFPMLIATRGFGKTFLLSLYALLRATLCQGSKVVVVGAAFRQSKILFNYMLEFWRKSAIFRSVVGSGKQEGPKMDVDQCNFYIGDSVIVALPIGDGCLAGSTQITYYDRFGTIQSNTKRRNELVWGQDINGNGNFRISDEAYDNGVKPTKVVETKRGFHFEGTYNHKMQVLRNNRVVWVRTDEMCIGDCILIDRSERWHNGDFNITLDEAYKLGTTLKEFLPSILSASKSKMSACLQGLFDTDGSVQINEDKEGAAISVSLTNTSETLINQVQYILTHYGIISSKYDRNRNENWNTIYDLKITGADVLKFYEQIGFYVKSKKQILLENVVLNKTRWFSIYDLMSCGRDVYYDEITSIKNSKCHTYDLHIPTDHCYTANGFLSHNSKIRGMRANYVLADEFSCLEENTLVETDAGLVRIGESNCSDKKVVTGDDSLPLEAPSNYIKTPPTDVYEVKLKNGYIIRCSENHQIMTQKGWKYPAQLTKIDYVESENYYEFPSTEHVTEKEAYLIGLLISKGTLNKEDYVSVNNTNDLLAKKLKNEYGFTACPRKKIGRKKCSKSFDCVLYDKQFRENLFKLGVDYSHKKIPWCILQSSRKIVISFLRGLFNCFNFKNDTFGLEYHSASELLCRDLHILVDKLGYDGYIDTYKSEFFQDVHWFIRWNYYNVLDFAKELGVDRSTIPLENYRSLKLPYSIYWHNGRKKWEMSFKYYGRSFHKRFNSVKDAEAYVERASQMIRYRQVESVTKMAKQQILYDYHLPKTHSFYAGGSRQHNSIPQEVFEVVIKGFGSVSANPTERAKKISSIETLNKYGLYEEANEIEEGLGFGNQTVISGTAYYSFNHFFNYWKRYKGIVDSKGDPRKLQEVLQGNLPPNFDWRDYSVIRIPYHVLPSGFMDETQIAQAQALMHIAVHQMEYGAIFAEDSDGFYSRRLIESCVCPVEFPEKTVVNFSTQLQGTPNKEYIYGIDPASESDNFAIVVLEIAQTHRRIVHCWTINRRKMRERIKNQGETEQRTFYSFCARKIRDLMKIFPTRHIGIDSQGGGIHIMEALHDPKELQEGEQPLWPYIKENEKDPYWWEKENKPTDGEPGLHILHMVEFVNSQFTYEANHGLKKDFETRKILFPQFDSLSIAEAAREDTLEGREYDTLEDITMEIEELKDEISYIEHTQTTHGRDKWDTPEIKLPGGKKGRLRKDRYSALIIANMLAHVIEFQLQGHPHVFIGGFVGQKAKFENKKGKMYTGPAHLVDQMNKANYGKGISRRR